MILYVTPKGGGEVIACESNEEAHNAMRDLHERHGATEFSVTRGDVVCDFCSEPGCVSIYQSIPGRKMHQTNTPEYSVVHRDSDGLWGACAGCDEILKRIGAGEFVAQRELAARSFEHFMKHESSAQTIPPIIIAKSIATAHEFFLSGWDFKPGKHVVTDDEVMGG